MVRVLTVDDSASARALLVHILDGDPDISVVGHAANGEEAVRLAERLKPDVITMDVVMPVTDGLEATRRIMASNPTPIVIVASHDPNDAAWVFQAIQAGALTVLGKPEGPLSPTYHDQAEALVSTVKLIAGVRVAARRTRRRDTPSAPVTVQLTPQRRRVDIVAIGASTGGPAAVARLLVTLPTSFGAPILLVQHIAAGFDGGFARWLSTVSPLDVRIALDREPLTAGRVYVAPTDRHLGVTRDKRISLSDDAPVGGFRPSATLLFRSVSSAYAGAAVGVILTGMGRDGADGLIDLRAAGGYVLAQDEATSVVFGMPAAAIAADAADRVLPIDEIGPAIARLCR